MDRPLDGFSIFGIIVFAFVVFCVNVAIKIPLPRFISSALWRLLVRCRCVEADTQGSMHIRLNLVTTPLLGVLLLLITTSIDGQTIRYGIVGEDGARPYDVLVLFISLAYIATALDATGALRYLAFSVSQKGNGSGARLYATLYTFFFAASVLVGNDPIVLSGTAFLAYFTRVTGIVPPTAWVFAQFLAANTASAVLVSSNPTNVLIAGAFELNFLTGYTRYTILPSVISALVSYPLLFYIYRTFRPSADGPPSPQPSPLLDASLPAPTRERKRSFIPHRIVPPDVSPRAALVDPAGAIFHVTLLLVTLAVLVGTSFAQPSPQVWMVTAPAAIIALARDFIVDWRRGKTADDSVAKPGYTKREEAGADPIPGEVAVDALEPVTVIELKGDNGHRDDNGDTTTYPPASKQMETKQFPRVTLPSLWRRFATRFPSTSNTIAHLPLPLLPFAIGMFILVQALHTLGWVDVFAGWLHTAGSTPVSATFVVGIVTSIGLCALAGTNIGATVLMVSVIRHPTYASQVDDRTLRAAIFSLAMASNVGAVGWALSASLAGLLWARILRQKGIVVTNREFAKWNAVPLVVLTLVSCAVVLGEVYWFD